MWRRSTILCLVNSMMSWARMVWRRVPHLQLVQPSGADGESKGAGGPRSQYRGCAAATCGACCSDAIKLCGCRIKGLFCKACIYEMHVLQLLMAWQCRAQGLRQRHPLSASSACLKSLPKSPRAAQAGKADSEDLKEDDDDAEEGWGAISGMASSLLGMSGSAGSGTCCGWKLLL